MKIILFSKDRACQCQLLLDSFVKNWPDLDLSDIHCLYTFSDYQFERGYKTLMGRYPQVNWKKEGVFCQDFYCLYHSFDACVGIFTDDCVVYRKMLSPVVIDNFVNNDEKVLCFSARLSPDTVIQNYLTGEIQKELINYNWVTHLGDCSTIKYRWAHHKGNENYGYIGSLDGCFYSRFYLEEVLEKKFYNCPRGLEGAIINDMEFRNKMALERPYIYCQIKSQVVVNSVNAVQVDPIPCGKFFPYSPKELNDMYMEDKVIDLDAFMEECQDIRSSHIELPFVFKDYNG